MNTSTDSPTSFTNEDGTFTRFRYLKSLEDHPACVTYLAEITDQNGATGVHVQVVVKFAASYGKEVHEFLARNGWAPTLRHYGPIRETGLSNGDLSGPAQNSPPGLHLRSDVMHMIVMDYTKPQPEKPRDVRGQIEKVLILLHANGYVFGDLRPPNILYGADGKVKFIDFDWCGRYDMKIRDVKLSEERQKQIEDMGQHVQIKDGPYVYYPLSMSMIFDMWEPGMEPLTPIRPIHDWMMFDSYYPKGIILY